VKKLIGFVIVIVIALVIWGRYSSSVKNAKEGPQGTPEKTVANFMSAAEKMSNLIWEEEENTKVKELLSEWKNVDAEDKGKHKQMQEKFKAIGIENPAPFFKDEKYAKTAFGVFCLFDFGDYEINEASIENNKATLNILFAPADFMGLKSSVGKMMTQKPSQKPAPSQIPFYLERKFYRWYITEIGGKEGELIDTTNKLRKYK